MIAVPYDEIYTDIILDLYKNPPNKGSIENPSLTIKSGNPSCGDEVIFDLIIQDNKIKDVKFLGKGCAISSASEALLTGMIKDRPIDFVLGIEKERLFEALGGIIQTRIKCATFGLNSLKEGLERFLADPEQKEIKILAK